MKNIGNVETLIDYVEGAFLKQAAFLIKFTLLFVIMQSFFCTTQAVC